MLELIKDAFDGIYQDKLSTNLTGQCTTDYNDARKNMTDLMTSVDPEALENFNFVSYDQIDDEIQQLRNQEKKQQKEKKASLKNINKALKSGLNSG